MKSFLCLLTGISAFGISASLNAETPAPNERRIVSYRTNGTPVYAVYERVGYDFNRTPIYRWVTHSSVVHSRPTYSYRTYRPTCVSSSYGCTNIPVVPVVHVSSNGVAHVHLGGVHVSTGCVTGGQVIHVR